MRTRSMLGRLLLVRVVGPSPNLNSADNSRILFALKEVRLKEYGLDTIEVIDDASGIAASDYDAIGELRLEFSPSSSTSMSSDLTSCVIEIALKHHTSKLSSFADLDSVSSFGFRGEALSSLCGLSSSMEIVTATSENVPLGTVIKLDRSGTVTDCSGRMARTVRVVTSVYIVHRASADNSNHHCCAERNDSQSVRAVHSLASTATGV